MKKIGLLAVIIFCTRLVFAQPINDSSKVEGLKSLLRAKIGADNGLEWEQKIGSSSVIFLSGGLMLGWLSDDWTDFKSTLAFVPFANMAYRNYYNIGKRMAKQKNTRNNSANYFFGGARTMFGVKNQNYFGLQIEQGWGAERSLGKRISVNAQISFTEHFYYDKPPSGGFNYLKLEPNFQWSFSYVF